jgi:hypothetical protein
VLLIRRLEHRSGRLLQGMSQLVRKDEFAEWRFQRSDTRGKDDVISEREPEHAVGLDQRSRRRAAVDAHGGKIRVVPFFEPIPRCFRQRRSRAEPRRWPPRRPDRAMP